MVTNLLPVHCTVPLSSLLYKLKVKDENVHRYAVREEKSERERVMKGFHEKIAKIVCHIKHNTSSITLR